MDIDLKIDPGEMSRLLRKGDELALLAAMSSMNRVARRIRTRTVRGVSKETRVLQREIRRRVRVRTANRRRQYVTLIVYGRPVAAIRAGGARPTLSGVHAAGRLFPQAFIARNQRGLPQVYKREPGAKRLPIDPVKIDIFRTAERVAHTVINRAAQQLWDVEFPRQLEWRLRKDAGFV